MHDILCGVRAAPLMLTATMAAILALAAGAAQAQQSNRLSPARYAAIDSTYAAFVELDGSAAMPATAAVRRVCDALDRTDPLLAITRTTCLAALKIGPAREAFAACKTPRGCSRAARRIRIAFAGALAASRASNRIVAVEVASGACRDELTVSGDQLRSMQKMRDGMRLLERALITRKRAVIRRAEQLIADSVTLARQQPATQQSHATFRRVCALA